MTIFKIPTKEEFAEMLAEAEKRSSESAREWHIVTGWLGMLTMEYSMMGIFLNCGIYYHVCQEKRKTQFSFLKKHGMWKARVNYKTLELDVFYGTTYLFSAKDLITVEKYIKEHGTN